LSPFAKGGLRGISRGGRKRKRGAGAPLGLPLFGDEKVVCKDVSR